MDDILTAIDPTVSGMTGARLLDVADRVGVIAKAGRDVYINRSAQTPVTDGELVTCLRPHAVLSLHSALSSIAHNPSDRIWCVVPTEWTDGDGVIRRPSTGKSFWKESNRHFEIRAIRQDVLFAPAHDDLFVTGVRGLSQATPEAALCHWLYLAKQTSIRNHGRGGTAWPDGRSADWRRLGEARLGRVAETMGITSELNAFMSTIGDPLNGKHVDVEDEDDDGPEMVF